MIMLFVWPMNICHQCSIHVGHFVRSHSFMNIQVVHRLCGTSGDGKNGPKDELGGAVIDIIRREITLGVFSAQGREHRLH